MASFSHGPMRGLLSDLDDRNKWTVLRGSESLIAGAGAGLISSIVTCPLDVVKTKLQAHGGLVPATSSAGPAGQRGGASSQATAGEGLGVTVRRIYTSEGARGFYRGLAPTIYGYLPTWAIYFTVYDRVKADLLKRRGIKEGQQDPISHVLAAMSGGATGTIITNPLWVIKTRFMTQSLNPDRPRYKHTYGAIRQIYQTEGLFAFYKGLVPSLFGVLHVAVQFPLYEKLKSLNQHGTDELPSSKILLCSSLSKAIASVTTYPHEVVRTRLQIQRFSNSTTSQGDKSGGRMGILDTIRSIARNEGFRGFYRGLAVNLVRTVPSAAMTILTYELLMRNLNELTKPTTSRRQEDDDGDGHTDGVNHSE